MILGIDEAGRGPWAGPLVVGAAVLGGAQIDGLTDSKKLTKKKREELYDMIRAQAVAYATGWVSAVELDKIGMSEALKLATRRAVEKIDASYAEIIIDGTVNFLAGTGKGGYVQTMKKADLLVPSVSAASILAKVERDRFMIEQDALYPGYGFGGHVGYGVAKHREAIERLGVTPLHRLSFAPLKKYRFARSLPSGDSFTTTLPARSPRSTLFSKSATGTSVEHSAEIFLGSISQSPQRSAGSGSGSAKLGESMKSTHSDRQDTTKSIGDTAESVVANYLSRQGHEILDRNWRTKICEIDIISQKGDTIYFTEVKYRKNADYGDGFAAITDQKLRQMKFAAEYYALKRKYDGLIQLAAASVSGQDFVIEQWLALE